MAYTPTNWKDRDVENPRTYTARQNEDGSITFFDAPGTINEAGTPVNAVNMNKIEEQLYKNDLERKITNCITEIPQDIKLELNNGTMTLKAGSKVYVPNGKNTDGSLKFDVVNVPNDISKTRNTNAQEIYFVSNGGATFNIWRYCFSGATAPTFSGNYAVWYDTANNIVKYTSNAGSTWNTGFSLPVCLSTSNTTQITSIDQVFNGFGYIGSTVFALPGVKGLASNGRNADGSLKNTEVVYKGVSVYSTSAANTFLVYIDPNIGARFAGRDSHFEQNEKPTVSTTYATWYSPVENRFRYTNDRGVTWTDTIGYVHCVTITTTTGGVITSFNPKTAFHAADDQEVVKTSGDQTIWGVKSFTKGTASVKVSRGDATYGEIMFTKKDGTRTGGVRNIQETTGNTTMIYVASDDGTSIKGSINMAFDGTTAKTSVPTPPASDNSTQIATTAWVRNYVKNTGGGANWASKVGVTRDTNYTAPSNGYIAALMQFDDASGTLTINNAQIFTTGGNVQSPSFTFVPVSKGDVVKLSGGAWVTAYFVPFK